MRGKLSQPTEAASDNHQIALRLIEASCQMQLLRQTHLLGKQRLAKQQVQLKRQEERQKRSFVDKGITVMTVDGERSFTINAAQIYKAEMNAQKTNKHKR